MAQGGKSRAFMRNMRLREVKAEPPYITYKSCLLGPSTEQYHVATLNDNPDVVRWPSYLALNGWSRLSCLILKTSFRFRLASRRLKILSTRLLSRKEGC